MSLKVVGCVLNSNQGTVTIESDLPDFGEQVVELQSADARRLAIAEAGRQGLGAASINGFALSPYPITTDSKPLDNPVTQPLTGYRIDVPVMGRPA